jgi:hypothetical protein
MRLNRASAFLGRVRFAGNFRGWFHDREGSAAYTLLYLHLRKILHDHDAAAGELSCGFDFGF